MKIILNKWICALLITMITITTSCGKQNAFSSLTTRDTKQQAEDYINTGDYNSSINLLEPYVNSNPSDQQAIGLLATSYMLLAGVNMLNLMVSILNSSSGAKNNFQAIVSAMPSGSTSNISLLTKSITTLNLISAKNANQNYQLAIASASLAILTIKANCLDSSGSISTSQTNAMSTTDANSVYTYLSNAQTAFSSAGIAAGSNSGSAMLANIINQINSTSGGSNSAKVINYIIAQK